MNPYDQYNDDDDNEQLSFFELEDDDDVNEQVIQQILSALNNELDEGSRVYIAGPMRGVPFFNAPRFFEAEAMLTARGFEVFNPARRDQEAGLDFRACPAGDPAELDAQEFDMYEALSVDLTYVVTEADAVVLLPGWQMSRGAVAEVAAAHAVGTPTFTYDGKTSMIEPMEVGPSTCHTCASFDKHASFSTRAWMLLRDMLVAAAFKARMRMMVAGR